VHIFAHTPNFADQIILDAKYGTLTTIEGNCTYRRTRDLVCQVDRRETLTVVVSFLKYFAAF